MSRGRLALALFTAFTFVNGALLSASAKPNIILVFIDDMGWDYDRFSSSGQETYDKICVILAKVKEDKNEN